MKNIINNFNEIIITKTLASQQNYIKKAPSTQFDSLLKDEVEEIKETSEIKQEDSPNNKIIQQLELENLNYLNKIFLSFL